MGGKKAVSSRFWYKENNISDDVLRNEEETPTGRTTNAERHTRSKRE
jgi:hypothetical protein